MPTDNFDDSPVLRRSGLHDQKVRLKIIGVGGAGTNTVDRLLMEELSGLSLAAINTDAQALGQSPLPEKLLIGRSVTYGLGTGGEREIGCRAADADNERIRKLVDGQDLVFLVAGLGGGTGSGVSPVVADEAAQSGATVIAFVTMPFNFEGGRRRQQAEDALVELRSACHAVVPLPNNLILQQIDEDSSVLSAFAVADRWITEGVRAIWSILCQTGFINVDLATLRQAFEARGGRTLFGFGRGEGPDCVNAALRDLMHCPLLHTAEQSRRADSLIVNLVGGPDLTMSRVQHVMSVVTDKFGSRDNTILGAVIDEDQSRQLSICVLGTTDPDGHVRKPASYVRRERVVAETDDTEEIEGERPPAVEEKAPLVAGSAQGSADSEGEAKTLTLALNEAEAKSRQSPAVTEVRKPSGSAAAQFPREKKRRFPAKRRSRKDGLEESQTEFTFSRSDAQRGYFEDTERNLYDGEDLDVPTFLRRGIRVQV